MQRPDEASIVFIVDEDCGSSLVEAIRAAGRRAIFVPEEWGIGALDDAWIPVASQRGTAIITRDVGQRRKPIERALVEHAGVYSYTIRGHGMRLDEMCTLVVTHLPAIVREILKYAPPHLGSITKSGLQSIQRGERWGGMRRQ